MKGSMQPIIPMRKSLASLNYSREVKMIDFSAIISSHKPTPWYKKWITRAANLLLIFS